MCRSRAATSITAELPSGKLPTSRVLRLVEKQLPLPERLLYALDDTPTQRYGPKVEGAGIHHRPTRGPANQKCLYGHVWVTLAWLVRHPHWGTLAPPLVESFITSSIAANRFLTPFPAPFLPGVDWQMKVRDARGELKSVYPKIKL